MSNMTVVHMSRQKIKHRYTQEEKHPVEMEAEVGEIHPIHRSLAGVAHWTEH